MKIPKMSPELHRKVGIVFFLLYLIPLVLDRHGFYHSPLMDILSSEYFFFGGLFLLITFGSVPPDLKNFKNKKGDLNKTRLFVILVFIAIFGHMWIAGQIQISEPVGIMVLIIMGTFLAVFTYGMKYEPDWHKDDRAPEGEKNWVNDYFWPTWSMPPKFPTFKNHLLIARSGGVLGLAFMFLIILFIVPTIEANITLRELAVISSIIVGAVIGVMLVLKWLDWIIDFLFWKFKRNPKD